MDLRQLKTFICVAESGSLNRASDRLRIAQPALSRQIKLLEHTVGTELFNRHVRGMDLTNAGKLLLSRISGPIQQLEQSVFEIKSLDKEIHGEVKLGVLPTIVDSFSVHLLEQINRQFPGISVHIREGYSVNLIEWLQSGELDASFLYGPASAYHLQSHQLLSDEIILMSPPGSLPEGKTIEIGEMAKLPLVMPNRPFGPRLIVDKIASAAGVQLKPQFSVDSFGIAVSMVMSGMCHGFMPISSVASLAKSGQIEMRRLGKEPAERKLILAQPHTSLNARATDAVTSSIIEVVASMREEGSWITHLEP